MAKPCKSKPSVSLFEPFLASQASLLLQYSGYQHRYIIPALRLEGPGHIGNISVPGSRVEDSAHSRVARNQGHQFRRVVNVDIIVQEHLVSPSPNPDEPFVPDPLIPQPAFRALNRLSAATRNNVQVSQFFVPLNFLR